MTTLRFVLEALTPISHGDTRTGVNNATNKRLFMRAPRMINGRMVYVPSVSENALRTTIFRRPLADHLIRTLGIAGQVPRGALNLLYAGGAMGGGERAPGDETVIGHEIGKLYPGLALMGGAVNAMILPRGKMRLSACLAAQEYGAMIGAIFPEIAAEADGRSAFDMVGDERRTRGTGDEASGNQMLYEYEVLAAGAKIACEVSLDPWASPEAVSAIARAVAEWDGFIGGQGRQGRGRMALTWLDDAPTPDAYDAHLAANADAMRAGLVTGTLGAAKPLVSA